VPRREAQRGPRYNRRVPDLIVVPTFNESGNIGSLLGRLRSLVHESHVLVVDDGSPDGTGA